jgi:hypothetical protein
MLENNFRRTMYISSMYISSEDGNTYWLRIKSNSDDKRIYEKMMDLSDVISEIQMVPKNIPIILEGNISDVVEYYVGNKVLERFWDNKRK